MKGLLGPEQRERESRILGSRRRRRWSVANISFHKGVSIVTANVGRPGRALNQNTRGVRGRRGFELIYIAALHITIGLHFDVQIVE